MTNSLSTNNCARCGSPAPGVIQALADHKNAIGERQPATEKRTVENLVRAQLFNLNAGVRGKDLNRRISCTSYLKTPNQLRKRIRDRSSATPAIILSLSARRMYGRTA